MKRFRIYDLRFMILIFIFFAFIIINHQSSIINQVYASEPASASASLLDKLGKLKQEIASKAAILKTEIDKKLTDKFQYGQITSIDDTKITLSTKSGSKTVATNEYTLYQNSISTKKGVRKNQMSIKDLSEGDFVYALGDIDDKQNLIAKKIVKADPPKDSIKSYTLGKIISIVPGEITINQQSGSKIEITVNPQTDIKSVDGEIAFSELKPGFLVALSGEKSGSSLKTSFIYLIPGKGMLKEKPATASSSL